VSDDEDEESHEKKKKKKVVIKGKGFELKVETEHKIEKGAEGAPSDKKKKT